MIVRIRLLPVFCVLGCVGSIHDPLQAQTPDSVLPVTGSPDSRAVALDALRQIIVNVADSDSTRQAQAQQLLLEDAPEAIVLAETLLDADQHPSTSRIMCRAIAAIGRTQPDRLSVRLAGPLLKLLAADDVKISVAAASALSHFQGKAVLREVADTARRADAPLPQRLVAIDVLRLNTYRRDVVAMLVGLLDASQPEVRRKVIGILRELSDTDHGDEPAAWQVWWQGEAVKTDAEWLSDQLRYQSDRRRIAETSLEQTGAEAHVQAEQFATRLGQALSAQYRLTPQPEREAQLLTWLKSDTNASRTTAIRLVAEQISEGNPPQGQLRDALRERFNDPDPRVRRMAIETIGALNNPEDADPLLARLENEPDDGVREVILRVLGQLRNPVAIPTLLEELLATDRDDRCVAAAADAIGRLAARGLADAASKDQLIPPLKQRYARNGAPIVRRAVLGAMAAIGDPAFKPEFQANLDNDDPEMLLEAIRGVAVVGNGAQLGRLADLTTHPDVRVRQRALAALGNLGTREQLGAVIARARVGVEPAQGPRDTAWTSFVDICKRLPPAEQLASAEYLKGMPNLSISYLEQLAAAWQIRKPQPTELPSLRAQLAALYTAQGRNAEAIPLWKQLANTARQNGDEQACGFSLQLLSCSLALGKTDTVLDLLIALSECPSPLRLQAATAVVAAEAEVRQSGDETHQDDLRAALALAANQLDLADRFPPLADLLAAATTTDSPSPANSGAQPSNPHQSD